MATKPAEADNRGRMICAWCGRDLGPSGTAQDSHGICAACDAKLREKAQRQRERLTTAARVV